MTLHKPNSLTFAWTFAVAALGVSMGVVSCTGKNGDDASRSGSRARLRFQLAGEPASLDPALAEDGASLKVLCNTMDGLVGYDGGGTLVSQLAESYEISEDGRRYDFTLRSQARWSDGKAVTPQDFVTAFRRALSPGSGSRLAGSLFPIRGARELAAGKGAAETLAVRDENGHLILELVEAAPYFIQALTLPVALPERADILEANQGRWPDTAPSTGAYRIAQHKADRSLILEKNPHYWNASTQGDAVDVEIVVVQDESASLNLFEQGKLDILTKIGPADLPKLRERPGVLHTDPFLATYYLSFNFKKAPFNDKLWRQAVSGAIRRDEIVKALDEGHKAARSYVPAPLEGAIAYLDPAPALASTVESVRKKAHAAPNAVTAVSAAFDTGTRNQQVMEQVQHDLKKNLGLKITLSNLDWKTYLKTIASDPPAIFRQGILSPFMDPIQLLEAFVSGNPNNYLKWSNASYDALVKEITSMKSGPQRAKKIVEAQAILIDREAIVVPIFHYVQNTAVSARVLGFRVNPFGEIRFSELRLKPGSGD